MRKYILFILLTLFARDSFSEITMPAIFADGMVLQRKQSVPVWGWAKPRTEVQVRFDGQVKIAKADGEGKWMIQLDPLQASSISRSLLVSAGGDSKTIEDVVVGEVWLCSGQSNMAMSMGNCAAKPIEEKYQPITRYIKGEIESADDDLLRQFDEKGKRAEEKRFKSSGDWRKSISGETGGFSGTAYFFGRELRRELGVPVGLIKTAVGGSRIEAWIPEESFSANEDLHTYYSKAMKGRKDAIEAWSKEKAEAEYQEKLAIWESNDRKGPKPKKERNPRWDHNYPALLFNGKINPLIPYAIKGCIWYQGEANGGRRPTYYSNSLQTLISSWRNLWGQGDFPFYYAQTAGWKNPLSKPSNGHGYVTVRDQKRRALTMTNTGMTVNHDIGEAKDIHPRNKVDAGKRLSRWALAKDYGKDIVYSGPIYKSHRREGSKIIITFDHVGSGLMTGEKILYNETSETLDELNHFQICGDDDKWMWATANIISASEVEVFHPNIPHPKSVAYAWAVNPGNANLYNKEGLPASLFIID